MSSQHPSDPSVSDYLLRPVDIAGTEFHAAMRGYDRDAVKRFLRRVSESYAAILRQRDQARALADEAADRIAAAEGEAQTSARQHAQLGKRCAQLEADLEHAQTRVAELDARAADPTPEGRASTDPAELEQARARIAELEEELSRTPEATPVDQDRDAPATDAGEIVVAALRVASELRTAARREAMLALKKARERSTAMAREAELQTRKAAEKAEEVAQLHAAAAAATEELDRARTAQAEAEREAATLRTSSQAELEQLRAAAAAATEELDRARTAQAEAEREAATLRTSTQAEMAELRAAAAAATEELDRARTAQAEAEREAELLRARAREEVEHTVASLEAQRERVQALLGNALEDALAALRAGDEGSQSMLDDLEARLSATDDAPGGADEPATDQQSPL